MRHCARADLAFFYFLFEVAVGGVHPEIPAHGNQYRIDMRQRTVEGGQPIMRLNLRRIGIKLQPQPRQKLPTQPRPIKLRICIHMRIKIPHSPIQLRRKPLPLNNLHLLRHPIRKIGYLLSHSGRTGRLPMRPTQHRYIRPVLRHSDELLRHCRVGGQEEFVFGGGEDQGVGDVVDVLARAAEMDVLFCGGELGVQG